MHTTETILTYALGFLTGATAMSLIAGHGVPLCF